MSEIRNRPKDKFKTKILIRKVLFFNRLQKRRSYYSYSTGIGKVVQINPCGSIFSPFSGFLQLIFLSRLCSILPGIVKKSKQGIRNLFCLIPISASVPSAKAGRHLVFGRTNTIKGQFIQALVVNHILVNQYSLRLKTGTNLDSRNGMLFNFNL